MNFLKPRLLLTFLIGTLFITACGDDETVTPMGDTPISSFQFQIDENNFLRVIFSNFSQNANSYSWDFGDGNMSGEENPTHTYDVGGSYTVVLTASNGTESKTSQKTVTVTDPNTQLRKLTGDTEKVWKLSRNVEDEEYPLQVGPTNRSEIWWAYGLNDPIGARPCLMEEEYRFNIDGTFTYDPKGQVFADYGIWHVDLEGECLDPSDPSNMQGPNGEDLTAWGAGTFTFDYNTSNESLTLSGLGAHVGLPKVGTDMEYSTPQPSVTYQVISLETEGSVDKLVLETIVPGGYWQIILVSYDNPADEPELPGAPPSASFMEEIMGSTVNFTNTSTFADSYIWDFGDGNMSTEESPSHTYAMDGQYTVSLTASNVFGESTTTKNIVIAANSVFSAEALHGGSSKVWKLNPEAGALSVGPAIGSGEWFATSADDVMTRSCTFDDTYTFNTDGSFVYNANGDVWAEGYMGVDPAGCIEEAMLSAEAMAWGSGTHMFNVTEENGADPAYVSVTGTGAFIALPKAFNGGEYDMGPPADNATVRYQVLNYVNDGTKEILVLTIDISENEAQGAYWTFTLVSE